MSTLSSSCLALQIERVLGASPPHTAANVHHICTQWNLGTLCSGADTLLVALDECARQCNAPLARQSLSCDIDPTPRLFMRLHGRQDRMFMDVTRLVTHDGTSMDAMTATPVVVPSVGMTIHGTVCRQFSSLCDKSLRTQSLRDSIAGTRNISSLATIGGVLKYILKFLPKLALFENVATVATSKNISVLREIRVVLEEAGYVWFERVINSQSCGSPQDRRRVLFGGVLLPCSSERAARFRSDMDAIADGLPSVDTAPPIDAYLTDLHLPAQRRPKRELSRGTSWLHEHRLHCSMQSVGVAGRAVSSVASATTPSPRSFTTEEIERYMDNPGVTCLPLRERDILRMKMVEFGDGICGHSLPVHTSIDFDHKPFKRTSLCCVTPRLKVFDFDIGRCYSGYELFKIQLGIPSDGAVCNAFPHLDQISDDQLRHLAGNAFSLPAFATVFIALVGSLAEEEVLRM